MIPVLGPLRGLDDIRPLAILHQRLRFFGCIQNGVDVETDAKARKWCREHVVIKRADLDKIAKWAKKRRLFADLKRLGTLVFPIAPGR